MSILSPFPARIRFINPDGTLTDEASKLVEVMRNRLGGTLGDVGADVFAPFLPEQPAMPPDVLQQQPADTALPDLVQQQAPGDSACIDFVQQVLDYSAGVGLALSSYRFSLKDTAVVPDVYGDGTHVAKVTVDQQGRLTHAESVPIDFPQITGANYTGSLTGKTVTITNGIITQVV